MKFTVPEFLSLPLAKTVILAGRFLPINIVKGMGLLMATAMGDARNVQRLCKSVRSDRLPLSLQYAILSESVENIVLLDQWKDKKGVNRPQQLQALETFDNVSSVHWDITTPDITNFLKKIMRDDHPIPEGIDVNTLVVKLCTRQQWTAENKRTAFSQLCSQIVDKYGTVSRLQEWALTDIYTAWRMDLNADGLVPHFRMNLLGRQQQQTHETSTLLQRCVRGAPNNVLFSMLNDCVSPQILNKCGHIFERANLSEDVLHAFIQKGMDVQEVLKNRYGHRKFNVSLDELENELADDSSHAIAILKLVQQRIAAENQKSVLMDIVGDVREDSVQATPVQRRKM